MNAPAVIAAPSPGTPSLSAALPLFSRYFTREGSDAYEGIGFIAFDALIRNGDADRHHAEDRGQPRGGDDAGDEARRDNVAHRIARSAERREGKGCGRTGRSRWWPDH